MALIEISHLSKSFTLAEETIHILRDVSLEVPVHSSLSILGHSGSGKSTFLNLVGGLDRANHGKIMVNGKDICQYSERELTKYRQQTIGFIFQHHYMIKDLSAFENVMLPARIAGMKIKEAQERALLLFERISMENRMRHLPHMLSGGERQRCAIIRALMLRPQVILADEPTGSLDQDNANIVSDLLFSLHEEQQSSLILVTHDYSLGGRCAVQYELKDQQLQLRG